ncbi:baseplate assembly protein [Campylobacter concisus]|uniref:Baseplate assembly protein n=1 Tax=Campylobacter concisus TaxID=199 RepID=A0A1Y5MZM5_9BACT|nr:baseplate J/gp47 family protein [Campylobacter concisus]OUT11072.1 baseplate assembly protein [Campylobacter concisus]
MNLKKLPYPNVIEVLKYDEILNNVKNLFKEHLTDDEISLLESDNYSALLETLAYRELLLRARINDSVKAMLLPFSTGDDLDNIVAIYGIERLKGERPTAQCEFSLSMPRSSDTYLPKGLILRSENGEIASLKSEVVIRANELKAVGVIILDEFTKTSKAKCEYIQTPLPFVLKAKQTSEFGGGAEVESDERLRERAVLSLERFSTAGSKKAYIYHALSANAKVEEASVLNGGPGIVKVYLKTSDMSEETRQSVANYLSGEKVRPLTDTVTVANATIKNIEVRAELELTDMFLQDSIDKEIKASKTSLSIGEDLNLSYVYSTLHKNGVYRARLVTPSTDTKVGDDSFIKVSFSLSYKKAEL